MPVYDEMTGIHKATVRVAKLNPVMGGRIGRVSVEVSGLKIPGGQQF